MATPTKPDYLRECMSDPALVAGPVPIDDFQKAWCVRCIQKDCERARLNGSLFARRTATWKENLFDKPPRAADDDPQFANIRAKKFLQLAKDVIELRQGGVNYEVQERELPAALRKPDAPGSGSPPPAVPATLVASPPPPPEPLPVTPPEPLPAAPPPVEAPPAQVKPAAPPAPMQNTPFQQGTMLSGAPAPSPSGEKIVEAGGSYVFGSDE